MVVLFSHIRPAAA